VSGVWFGRVLSEDLRTERRGFEGLVFVSEGLLEHHPPGLDRKEKGEAIPVLDGDAADTAHSMDLGNRDHLISGVDEL
jgi:hypothetical protein